MLASLRAASGAAHRRRLAPLVCAALATLAAAIPSAPLRPAWAAPQAGGGTAGGGARAIAITVDASAAPRRILHVREQIPVDKAGPMTLHYPRWQPGAHGPVIPPLNLTGLSLRANGKPLAWRRDEVDVSSFHVEVPAATAWIEASFDYVSPPGGGLLLTEQLALIDWIFVVLYPDAPEGRAANAINFSPRIRLPPGWKAAGALVDPAAAASAPAGELALPLCTLETLVDSPLLAGAFLQRFVLPEAGGASHEIDVAADGPDALEAPEELQAAWARMPAEALALFGARHYRRYQFLLSLSNEAARAGGLEHHESSDNKGPERTLVDEVLRRRIAALLPHEFVHSWNGKFRRPAGLCTPDLHSPMKDELLWVYEGLTTYFAEVLTARTGLRSIEEAREQLALTASDMEYRAGRQWRPLQDTAIAVASGGGGPDEFSSWRRGLDYYPESTLIWLEVDTTLRRLSGGKASMDDFARRFHGGDSGGPALRPYIFDDVVGDLEALAHHDWRALLRARLDETTAHAPLSGITAGGWRLVWNDAPNELLKASEASAKMLYLRASIGMVLKEDGTIVDVTPGMPAAAAGATPGMRLRAVNGRRFSREVMESALRATRKSPQLELVVENQEWWKTLKLSYGGGLRTPHLERVEGTPDVLSAILAPRVKKPGRTPGESG